MTDDRNALADEIERLAASLDGELTLSIADAPDSVWIEIGRLAYAKSPTIIGALRSDAGAEMREAAPATPGEKPHSSWFVFTKMRLAIEGGRGVRLRRDELRLLHSSAIGPLMDAAREYGLATDGTRPAAVLMPGAIIVAPTSDPRALPLTPTEDRRDAL